MAKNNDEKSWRVSLYGARGEIDFWMSDIEPSISSDQFGHQIVEWKRNGLPVKILMSNDHTVFMGPYEATK